MMNIAEMLKPLTFQDENSNRQGRILHIILWSLLFLAITYLIFSLIFSPQTAAQDLIISGVGILVNIFLLVLLRQGHLHLASILQVACFWSLFTVIAFSLDGILGPAYMMGYILVILVAGILLGGPGALVMTILSLLSGLALVYFQENELLPFRTIPNITGLWIASAFIFPMCAILQYLAAQALRRAVSRSQESENEYRRILDSIQDAYYRSDLQGRLVMASPSFLDLFGYNEMDEILGQNLADHYYPDPADREKFLQAMEANQEVRNYFETLKRRDGSLITVSTASHYINDSQGKRVGIEGIIRDVTELMFVEKQRRESEAAYRILFEENPLAAIVTDYSGICVDVNPTLCTIFGVSREEIVGTSVFDLGVIPEKELKKLFELGLEQGGLLKQHEVVLNLKKDRAVHVLISSKPIIYHSEPHILAIFNDITRRVEAEKALRESETRFRSLSDATLEGVMVHRKGVILDVNRKFAEIFGYENPEELIGKNGYQFLLTPASGEEVNRRTRHNPDGVFEVEGVRKDGSIFPGETQSRDIHFRGEKARVVSMRDISLRKITEAELRRLNRALRTISKCNEALVRSGNQEDLLREICKTIVDVGEYQVACIKLVQKDGEDAYRSIFSFSYSSQAAQDGEHPALFDCWEQFSDSLHVMIADRQAVFLNRQDERQESTILDHLPEMFSSLAIIPLYFEDLVLGLLVIISSRADAFDAEETNLISDMAADLSYGLHAQLVRQERNDFLEKLEVTNRELAHSYDATLEGWSNALELRERETAGHSQRVVQLTQNIARELGIPEADLPYLRMGALLHDIGKMGIPDAILLKPGPLDEGEWITMRQHPQYAYDLLKGIPQLQPALEIPLFHHERWDGSGYPQKLAGENIPLSARIFAVVDVWDALISARPYRPAWNHEEALNYILDQSGKLFDPQVVKLFKKIIEQQRNSMIT
jgi:PAS domain S-box-containing protein